MTFTPRTWVVGETVTAALMNQEIRDQFNAFFGAWSTYTVTWTGGTNPSLGNGTLVGRYIKIGRTVQCHIELICGSTTTYGSGTWAFSLPATASGAGTGSRIGSAHAVQSSTRYAGQPIVSPSATDMSPFFPSSSSSTLLSVLSPTVPFTWASGSALRQSFTYETAS